MTEERKFDIAFAKLKALEEYPASVCPEFIEALEAAENWKDLDALFRYDFGPIDEELGAVRVKVEKLIGTYDDNALIAEDGYVDSVLNYLFNNRFDMLMFLRELFKNKNTE